MPGNKLITDTSNSYRQQFVETNESREGLAPPILLQYWRVILRWKWPIVAIILASLAAGLIITLLITPKYTATARIEISREQQNITKVEGLESANAGRDLEFYQTQYSLLSSRALAERVARSMRLSSRDDFFAAHGVKAENTSIFAGQTGAPISNKQREQRELLAVSLLQANISISPVRGSRLIDVSYKCANASLSAQIANSWTQEFIGQSMDRRFSSTADARKFLEGRLSDLRAKLETSEREVVNYASEKGIVALGTSKSIDGKTEVVRTLVSSDLEALNQALADATSERVKAESRANARSSSGASSEALGNVAISTLRQRRAEVAAELAKLLVQFEPGYPAARALSEQIRALDTSISREEARVQNSRSAEFSEAVQREISLKAKVESLKGQMDAQQRNSIQYNIFQRDADTNRELYNGLLQRYKEIGVAGIGANNISIVDIAKIPGGPSAPSLPLNMLLALMAGLVLAATVTFALEQIDEGMRDPSQVNRLLQIPLLGSVPDIGNEDTLTILADAKSALSEAYVSIRSNLAFSTDHGVPKTLMVTSTRPAEGKSTTSFAIASVLGRTGKRVVIVDADMRSPSMHVFVGGSNNEGLSNFLAGENDWKRLVKETSSKGLSMMPAGPTPPSASELLSSDRMAMLIEQMLQHFDHVIIDSPPILGLADAPLLSRAVEGCVFVIEAEGVAVRGVKSSLERLRSVHAHIFGAVLTKMKSREAGYGYGYGYGDNDDMRKK